MTEVTIDLEIVSNKPKPKATRSHDYDHTTISGAIRCIQLAVIDASQGKTLNAKGALELLKPYFSDEKLSYRRYENVARILKQVKDGKKKNVSPSFIAIGRKMLHIDDAIVGDLGDVRKEHTRKERYG